AGFPDQRTHDADPITINYNIEYKLVFASESYEDEVRQFILDNSVNGTDTGTILDETALEYQKGNINDPQRIFYPRDGRSIDGQALEDWFSENPYVEPPGLGYMFYLLNFSEFDSPDHELEHWFDYSPIDPDTGESQDWFRLEWDNALNPDVMLQYSGFGGKHNIYILDPSADQWYLRWARIWWETQIDYEYMSIDMDEKVMSLDLSLQSDIDELTSYLFEYMYDPVTKLMFPRSPMSQQNDVTAFVETGYLKCIVICMDVQTGVSIDSLQWVTNAEVQKLHLEELFPFIEWEVDVEFIDISLSESWNDLFWDYADVIDGKTIVDGYGMFDAIRNQVRPQYVDINDENINVFGVVFIKKNMEMHVYGRQYTGLGGGGQTVIWKSWERYYRPDEVTPKAGISAIQLHETMHAIGLGHTWSVDHYVGDFSFNAMGYYGTFNGTGRFEQNWVQSTYLDQLEGSLVVDFEENRPSTEDPANERTILAEQMVLDSLALAREYYNTMDWLACYNELINMDHWISTMIWTMSDDEAPEIVRWGVNGNPMAGNATVWATILDDLSGVQNASVHVRFSDDSEYIYPCRYASGNWTATIYQLPVDMAVWLWVEAQDKGLNTVKSDERIFGSDYLPYNPLQDSIVISAIIIGSVAIIAILIIKRRRVA
ncbi:MAG: hypothetical protein ACFFDR_10070, partial [Candidatus Thorarchaeota archaeon]